MALYHDTTARRKRKTGEQEGEEGEVEERERSDLQVSVGERPDRSKKN